MTEGGGSIKAMGFGFRWMDFLFVFSNVLVFKLISLEDSFFTVLC